MKKTDDESIQKTISKSLGDFFDKILVPYLDAKFKVHDEDHDEVIMKLDHNQKEHDQILVKLESIENKVDGHQSRIKKLEKTLQTS